MPFSLLKKLESTDKLLTVRDIMDLTGWGKTKVVEMINAGTIPPVNFANHARNRKRSTAKHSGPGEKKLVDPHTWAYVLKHADPMMAEAARRG